MHSPGTHDESDTYTLNRSRGHPTGSFTALSPRSFFTTSIMLAWDNNAGITQQEACKTARGTGILPEVTARLIIQIFQEVRNAGSLTVTIITISSARLTLAVHGHTGDSSPKFQRILPEISENKKTRIPQFGSALYIALHARRS
jgi:hypothetical protein